MTRIRLATLVVAVAIASSAFGADTEPAARTSDRLATARTLIAEQRWTAAIDELRRVDDRASADWNNLMGYSLRKSKSPDWAASERYYDEALRIDPQHRGALEYSGVLYLQRGDLAKAEARLAALDKACRLPCGEYTDLKKAIADFKANGHAVVRP